MASNQLANVSRNDSLGDFQGLESNKAYAIKNRNLLLISLMFCNYWMGTSYILLVPYFRQEIVKRGGHPLVHDALLAMYQIVIISVSPFVGKVPLSLNILSYGSIFSCGFGALLMSIIYWLPSDTAFLVLAFVARTFDSIGSCFYSASIYSLLVMIFPENKAIVISSMESFNGLGMIVGPAFGEVFFHLGGFSLPFIILSVCFFICAGCTKALLPNAGNTAQNNPTSLIKLVFHHSFLIDILVCFSAYFAIGYNSATLETHLHKFKMDDGILIGVVVALGGMYILFVPIWGRFCDKLKNLQILTGIAMLLTLIGLCLVGPLPFIPVKTTLWLIITSEILLGVGMGGQLICGIFDGIKSTIARDYPDIIQTYTAIFGTLLSATAFGSLVGPFFGSILTQMEGYIMATTCASGIELLVTVILWIYIITKSIRFNKDGERTHLLSEVKIRSNPDID